MLANDVALTLLICAGASFAGALLAWWYGSVWSAIAGRVERTVELRLYDSEATPRHIILKAGVVTMVLHNEGQESCALYLRGPGIEVASPSIRTGRKLGWTVHLSPGVYRLSTSVADQNQEGEGGSLTVVPALGSGDSNSTQVSSGG